MVPSQCTAAQSIKQRAPGAWPTGPRGCPHADGSRQISPLMLSSFAHPTEAVLLLALGRLPGLDLLHEFLFGIYAVIKCLLALPPLLHEADHAEDVILRPGEEG